MEYDLPPLLSDGPSDVDSEGSLSGGEAAEGEDSNQAPVLISYSSSGSAGWRPTAWLVLPSSTCSSG